LDHEIREMGRRLAHRSLLVPRRTLRRTNVVLILSSEHGARTRKTCDLTMKNVDSTREHCDLSMRNDDITMKHGDLSGKQV